MRLVDEGAENRDRSTGLVLFGVVEIVIGGLCALLFMLTAAVMLLLTSSQTDPALAMGPRTTIPGLSLYALLAVVFVWLGLGSVRARRWARELSLVVAWIWLLTGLCTVLLLAFLWPQLTAMMLELSGLPHSWVAWTLGVALLVTVLLHVLLPGAMVLFYRRDDVAATCAARDSSPQWTDSCSPHILSLGVLYALAAYTILLIPVYGFAVPFFGTLVAGPAGWLVIALSVGCCVWLVVGTYRQSRAAWWAGVAATVAAGISTTFTFSRVSVAELIATAPLNDSELGVLQVYGGIGRHAAVVLSFVTWASVLAYQIYVKRFFCQGGESSC